ncbi:transcriptional regulator [Xenorhabdus nematophila]|uniref:Helix-turn-helix domain protein n=1 Tax=Xenorhabdus nematophila (strain ATCC 19061 / DSM 3370 / CCUG 14189 / LMG 1036 / NCIMB 9965 / AN6) TaxID=406817 RepID=D3VAH8_XENNA|nr:transcriptional regulator [Xenorhabdus nematophila]CEE94325.1 putative Helix-turn-helix domain protein [Xenorhabdus nematophila str. Anatoliense]CEF31850.1 putative Helix-turn-helix domain protein [Xenorhabdus nematophila str. Websteri]AYA39628.1 transcriptional regulator [Xenorhabdus nematophila]KHD29365.1 transcriptional regulator [Xenorhabdus nematophila]MBA0018197.1 transcriptional regulator [Xenorhabdus nematophila]
MNIKPIRTEQDYQYALKTIAPLFDNQPEIGTPEFDYMEVMVLLIEAYEAEHYPIDPPDPIEAIKYKMEQSGLTVKDLEPAIGKSNRVYEILNRKRNLTLPMIRNLHNMFGIPANILIKPTKSAQ